jgi:Arrestin (or S-antigen), N-terminal domain
MSGINIRLDKSPLNAGTLIKGDIELTSESHLTEISGINLELIGEEVTSMTSKVESKKEAGNIDPIELPSAIRSSVASIIEMKIPVTTFTTKSLEVGRTIFPFQFQVPSDLPSTMNFSVDVYTCDIRYRLVAYLSQSNGETHISGIKHITMIAKSKERKVEAQPVVFPLEQFQLRNCYCIDRGCMTLGWDTDSTIGRPGGCIKVGIIGKNESRVQVKSLSVNWDEVVTWKFGGDAMMQVNSRTLASQEIIPRNEAWMPLNAFHNIPKSLARRFWKTAGSRVNTFPGRLEVELMLPLDARDSFQGELMTVQHMLSVKVVTNEWCTDFPESCALVTMQNHLDKQLSIEHNNSIAIKENHDNPMSIIESCSTPQLKKISSDDESNKFQNKIDEKHVEFVHNKSPTSVKRESKKDSAMSSLDVEKPAHHSKAKKTAREGNFLLRFQKKKAN